LKSKVGVLLFSGVFMLGFGGFGVIGLREFFYALAAALGNPQADWIKVVFMIPFGTLFPLVGLGAAWIFFKTLLTPAAALAQAGAPAPNPAVIVDARRKGVWALLLFTVFWNLLAFPIATVALAQSHTPAPVKLLVTVFPVIGVVLAGAVWRSWRQTAQAAPATLTLSPAQPRVGQSFSASIHMPGMPSAAAMRLRLVCERVDHRSSSRWAREIWTTAHTVAPQPHPAGSARFSATFAVPPDQHPTQQEAPNVDIQWKLVLEDHVSGEPFAFEFTLAPYDAQAAQFEVFDSAHHAGSTFASAPVIDVPPGIARFTQDAGGWQARFAAPGASSGPVVLGVYACIALVIAWTTRADSLLITAALGVMGFACLLGTVHFATRVQTVRMVPGWLTHQRASLLKRSLIHIPLHEVTAFSTALAYTQSSGTSKTAYYHIHMQKRTAGQHTVSPALPMHGLADAVAAKFTAALHATPKQNVGAAPVLHDPYTTWRRLAWPLICAALCALAFIGVQQFNAQRQQAQLDVLMQAQDASDLPALQALLDAGHDPNTRAANGASLLMMAAARGELAHVELLLARGADVNFTNQTGKTTRGDTALLTALYGGHEAVFNRLLQAGARLDVQNMWDWTPVHMAAAGNCVPCLETLAARGLSLTTPAPASRGETPLLMAAGKGKIEAMAWLIDHGADPTAQETRMATTRWAGHSFLSAVRRWRGCKHVD
jgi:hypothetical protein